MNTLISYLVTCKNETDSLSELLNRLITLRDSDDEIVILDDYSDNKDTISIIEKFKKFNNVKVIQHHLDNNYSEHKNYGKSLCKGDYIFQIDADELPSELLLTSLKELIELNKNIDLFWIPRINDFRGVNHQNAAQWGWRLTPYEDRFIVNFPDLQGRLFRNVDYMRWERRLHEKVEGAKTYVHLPYEYELSLHHNKTIERQIETNIRYNKQFTQEENKGFKV